jgi:hypothetical protein
MAPEQKVRSCLLLQPRGGDYAAVIAFFHAQDVLGKAVRYAGAWSAELHQPLSGHGPLLVTALWDSADAYAGWLAHPVRAELGPAIAELVEDDPALTAASGLYRVVLAASR